MRLHKERSEGSLQAAKMACARMKIGSWAQGTARSLMWLEDVRRTGRDIRMEEEPGTRL